MDFNSFVKNLTFMCGFEGNRLGQNVCNDNGIIPYFHTNSDFDIRFICQRECFPQRIHFYVSFMHDFVLCRRRICEASMFPKYKTGGFLFPRKTLMASSLSRGISLLNPCLKHGVGWVANLTQGLSKLLS